MYNVRLTKIKSNHNRIRSKVIVGKTNELPVIGEGFQMLSQGLVIGVRHVQTSPIELIEKIDNTYQFNTANSIYKLEVLSNEDDICPIVQKIKETNK